MEESRNQRLAKNTLLLYVRTAISMLVSLYTSRVVLEVLGFADYGLYGVVGGVVTMFTFLNNGMSAASSRYISIEIARGDKKRTSDMFSMLFFSHVFIALIVLILAETVGLWFCMNKLEYPAAQYQTVFWVYQISIISTLFVITLVPYSSLLIAHENMKVYAYASIAEVVMRLLIVYLLYIIPGTKLIIWSLLALGVQLCMNIFYRIYVRRHYDGVEIHRTGAKKEYREIFGFVGTDLIGNMASLAQGQGMNILLNLFFGPTVNAARSLAYTIQGLAQQFSNNFLTAIRPQITKLHGEDNDEEMLKLSFRGSCMGFYLLMVLALPVMINIRYVLELWLGSYPDYTIPFLRIILLIALVQVLKTPRTMVFHALAKIKMTNLIVGTMLLLAFPAAYLFLKLGYGPTSVFWVTLIDILLTEIASTFILRRYIKYNIGRYFVNVYLRCIIIFILAGMIPAIMKAVYPTPTFWPVACNCVVCLLSTIFFIYLLGLNKVERQKLKEVAGRKLRLSNRKP